MKKKKKSVKRTGSVLAKAQRSATVKRIRARRNKLAAQMKKLGRLQTVALKKAIKKLKK